MRRKRIAIPKLFVIAALAALSPERALAWGPLAHQIVYRAALAGLRSSPFRDWLQRNVDTGARQSMTPDIDWKPFQPNDVDASHRAIMERVGPIERPTHFFDADLLLPASPEVRRLLRHTSDYSDALPILRQILRDNPSTAAMAEKPWELGSVPWRTAQVWSLLVDALKRQDFPRAQLYTAVLTHYAAEHTNPLHTDSRYDGVPTLTRGTGLHLAYEMLGFEAAMESRGAVRPLDSRGVWQVRPEVLARFTGSPQRLPVRRARDAVGLSLDLVVAGRPAVTALSSAYGGAPRAGETGSIDLPAFFRMPVAYEGFRGTVQTHAEKHVADAAAFATALLDGAYEAATHGTGRELRFPTVPIAFDRAFAIDSYPMSAAGPIYAASLPKPSTPASNGPTCLGDLSGLLAR